MCIIWEELLNLEIFYYIFVGRGGDVTGQLSGVCSLIFWVPAIELRFWGLVDTFLTILLSPQVALFPSFFPLFFSGGAGFWTQDLVNAMQVLCHCAIS